MSSQPKITSKNLSYSSDLPPFLAKLRGQQQQDRNSDSPDPILAARRRAARPRSASEEAEDAPLIVDEAGNTIAFPSATDADAPTETNNVDVDRKIDGLVGKEKDKEREVEKMAGIGAAKKRKVGRVVGGHEEDGDGEENSTRTVTARTEKESSSTKKKEKKHAPDTKNPNSTKSGSKQGKKKTKKIKLSFGDDGD
ncbi:hypothetical protein F4804DRAFT_303671 [Jackrogersella minutella]|nr:hypothetical protein F4804DRAFT_303671 [Jackrogersella minutella]